MTASTQGDIGDIVILLSILKQLDGGPHTLLLEPSNGTKARKGAAADTMLAAIKPLAEAQPYIKEMRMIEDGESVDWASAGFRRADYQHGNTLFDAHLNHLIRTKDMGAGFNALSKWLEVPQVKKHDRIVIARSGRHRNLSFPWAEVVHKYSHRLLFVGLRHEWREFIGHFGYVDYAPTENMLQVAQVIAGTELFIGNQSSPNAIAEGLKVNMIQEVSLHAPDCIYRRDNAQHCYDGIVMLPSMGMGEDQWTTPELRQRRNIHTDMTPPGQWQFPNTSRCLAYNQMHKQVKALPQFQGKSDEDVRAAIIDCTMSRCPDWQNNNMGDYSIVRTAIENSKATPPAKPASPPAGQRLVARA